MKPASKPAANAARRKRPQAGLGPAFDHSPLPMWVYEAESQRVLDANQAALDASGYSKGEMLAMKLHELRADRAATRNKPHSHIQPGALPRQRGTFQLCRKDGGLAVFQMTSRAVDFDGGRARLATLRPLPQTEDGLEQTARGASLHTVGQREAQEALRESEESYKRLFEAAPIGIAMTDLDGTLLAFNDALLEPGGYSREDFVAMGNVIGLYADPAQRAAALALLEKQGYLQKYPVQFRRKNGSIYHAQLSLTRLEIRGQLRLQGLIEDMTQRQAAEDALRKSEALYRGLFNNAVEGMFRTMPDGRFVSANPALVRMLGYESESDLLSLHVADLYADAERHVHNLERIARSGELRDFEIHLRRRDGSTLIVLENSRAILDANGDVALYEGTLTDITERKQMEEALRTSEGELRALFEAVPDLVLVLDKEGRYLKIAPGHEDMLYAPPEELLGRSISEVFSESKAEEFLGCIRQTLRTHQPVHFEYSLRIGAQIRWFSGAVSALTEESAVWVARDITPQKEAEEQVQRRLVELEALYESGLALSRTLDPRQISKRIIEVLTHALHWEHAEVHVRRGDSDEVELLAFSEAPGQGSAPEASRPWGRGTVTRVGQGMAGWVMRHGRLINSGNLAADPRYEARSLQMHSGLYVPIWGGGRVLGCISVETQQMNAFNGADERLLTTLASQAAAALENARLFAETQERVAESLALYEHTRDLTTQADPGALFKTLAERVASLLKVPCGAVYLYDAENQRLEIATCTDENLPVGTTLQLGEGMAGRVAQSREPLIVQDYRKWDGCPPKYAGQRWAGVLEVPMLYRGELIGVLAAFDVHPLEESAAGPRRKFTEEDIWLLSLFAAAAGGAIYSARLREDTRRRLHEFESLAQVGDALSGTLELEPLLENILRTARQAIPSAEKGTVLLRGEGQDHHLHVRAQVGYGDPRLTDVPFDDSKGYAGRAYREMRPILIRDTVSEYEIPFGQQFDEVNAVQSAIVAPLIVKGKAIGAIALDNLSRMGAFDEGDLRLLMLFASSAAVAIENARLFEETRRRAAEREVLYEATRDLSSHAPDLSALLASLVNKACRLMSSHGSGMYLYDAERRELELVAVSDGQRGVGVRLKVGQGAAGRVAETRAPLVIDDYRSWEGRRAELEGKPYRAHLEVPMLYGGELAGVLEVFEYGESERKYNESDVKLLSLFASQAAGALHSARLFEQVSRRASEFEMLYQTAADISSQTNVRALLNTVIQRSRDLMDAAGAVVYLYDPQDGTTELSAPDDPDLRIGTRLAPGEGVSGRIAVSKQPLIVDDYQAWEGRSPQYEGIDYSSVIGVPMLYSGQLIGVLNVFNKASRDRERGSRIFSTRDASTLELLANFAAGAVYVARLLEQTRRRVEQLSALHAVDTTISSTTDLRVSLQAVLDSVLRQLGVDAADVLLLNPSTLMLQYAAGSGFFTHEINRSACPIGTGQAGRAALERQVVEVRDLAAPEAGFTRTGLVAAERFKSYMGVPLLAKGEVKGVLEIFQRTPLKFDDERRSLLEILAGQAAIAIDSAQLFEGLERANLELMMAYDATIEGWSQALELRDQETQGHSNRVLDWTMRMASALGLPDRQLRDIRRGVLLHDIGKMGIPDSILHKPGPLSAQEWEVMHQHPQYAYNMLAPIVYLRNSIDIPYAHHERWNGEGYPRGLKGDTIPLAARIFSVVDVYDALTSNRPYRSAWSQEKALEYIAQAAGTLFDPQIVQLFLQLVSS